MAEDQNQRGYIVDLDAWTPEPSGTFAYQGKPYPAFRLGQLDQQQQNLVRSFPKRVQKAKSMTAVRRVIVDAIRLFVPDAPVKALMGEKLEKLDFALGRLIDPEGTAAARPTKGRRKSPSANPTAP